MVIFSVSSMVSSMEDIVDKLVASKSHSETFSKKNILSDIPNNCSFRNL